MPKRWGFNSSWVGSEFVPGSGLISQTPTDGGMGEVCSAQALLKGFTLPLAGSEFVLGSGSLATTPCVPRSLTSSGHIHRRSSTQNPPRSWDLRR